MRILNQFRIVALALACAALVMTAKARDIEGNSGNNFSLAPTATPGVFMLTHPGVAQVSSLGNCTFDGEEVATFPATPDQPLTLKGTWRFTSADGSSTLDAEVAGTGTPDPANPNFVNLRYRVKFTGGTGKMAAARGKAEMTGVAMLTSPSGGTTTFVFAGEIFTRGGRK
jgi:hypothetical protein